MVTSLFRRESRDGKDLAATERRNILVAVAGNSMDEDLVRMACALCLKGKTGRGRIIAINVVEVPRTLPLDAVVDNSANDRVLDTAIAVAQGMNVDIEAEVIQAREAGPAIVDEANDRDCRLIMLGLVPRSRFGQFDLGKTVPYVMEHAHGRVWVMRDEM